MNSEKELDGWRTVKIARTAKPKWWCLTLLAKPKLRLGTHAKPLLKMTQLLNSALQYGCAGCSLERTMRRNSDSGKTASADSSADSSNSI